MKHTTRVIAIPLLGCLVTVFAGCGLGDGSLTSAPTSSVDITDAILSNSSANCADYAESYSASALDVNRNKTFQGSLTISTGTNYCLFTTNAIPNHAFNDGISTFVTNVLSQNASYKVPASPQKAATSTPLSLTTDNAIFLNGVKLDLLAAACYGIGDGKIGCTDMSQPWRYDPMFAGNNFGTDSHHAHTQPDGTYHYHGSPVALFYTDTAVVSPVIGFAADGFPIFGSWFDDGTAVRKATSSYQLKSGARQPINTINPGGTYDGTYRDDYEYVAGLGDLDECNGMTVGSIYGYYVTETYPWVLGCFSGTPDPSFNK